MAAKKRARAAASPAWFALWPSLSPITRHVVCSITLVVVAVVFMAPIVFSGDALSAGDTVQFKAMAESLFDWEQKSGSRPLWALNPFGGMPSYMISYELLVPQIDQVARWARMLFWPTSHLVILFFGVYGLIVFLVRDRLAGVLGAIAFGLTTYLPILLIAGHNSKYVALAYAPWMLWAFAVALKKPSVVAGLLFAVAVAVNLRAGHLQITYYAAFTLGVWWLAEAVAAIREGRFRTLAMSTGYLVGGGVLAVLMVAQPYLIQAEYKRFTIRGAAPGGEAAGLAWSYAMAWSQGPSELLTLLIANAFGGSGATYWGPKTITAGPHYVGGVTLLLALVALLRSHARTVVALSIAAVLMTLFSLGSYFEPLSRLMFDYFPLFSAFRVPETWLSMVALVLAVLAAIGVKEAITHDVDPVENDRRTRTVLSASFGLLAVLALLYAAGDAVLSFEKPNEFENLAAQVAAQRPDVSVNDPQVQQLLAQEVDRRVLERRDLFQTDAGRTLIVLLIAALVIFLQRRRKLPGWALQVALIILVAADLGGVGRRYLNSDMLVPARRAENAVPRYGFDDYLIGKKTEAGGPGHFRVWSLEGSPTESARPANWHETLSGYHGAKLRRFQDFLENVLVDPNTGAPNPAALAMTNTRYVVARRPIADARAVYADDQTGFSVYELDHVLPRAWFVDGVRVIDDAAGRWQALLDPAFDPGRTAILEAPAPPLSPSNADSVSVDSTSVRTVRLETYEPEHARWSVETDRDRLLVIGDVFYPAGWTAEIDGVDAPILPVNDLIRGVVIPAGRHDVALTFAPKTHALGVWISAISTLLVYGGLFLLLLMGWRRRRDERM